MTFTTPLFLLGLLAVGIPIAVHLFNFRRYKKVYFSNVDYLQQLQTETKRQSHLRELLILAARILTIVFLVLAFAQPVILHNNQHLLRGSRAVSVYIDNSFSMENTNTDGTLLEMAKQKAREIAGAYKPSDNFQLMTNDVEGAHFRWVSRDEFLSMVDEIKVSSASPLLSSMATKQFDFLHSSPAPNKFAYIISDFQNSGTDLDKFPNDTTITSTFVHLDASTVNNFSIDSVEFNAPVVTVGSTMTANVWVSNLGNAPIDNVPLKLFINGKQRALASVTLPNKGSMMVPLSFTINDNGILNGRIETVDYPITFDDVFFFSLNIRNRITMLAINGKEENIYLHRLFSNDSTVDYHSVGEHSIDFNTLNDHSFIVLNELSSIPSGLAQTLFTFVEAGGSLLVVPATDADIASYNQTLQLLHAPLLGSFQNKHIKAGGANTQATLYRGVFEKTADENMELPSLNGYFQTSASVGTVKETLIPLSNRDDYLTSTACGNGKVYLFTAPLQPHYSDFVRQALFVPTLYNMALFSQPLGTAYITIDNTSPILLSHRGDKGEGTYRLTNSDKSFELIPDIRHKGDRNYIVPHSQLKTADNYLLLSKGNPLEGLAFNYSRRESAMEFLSRNDLARQIRNHNLTSCAVVRNAAKPLNEYIRRQTQGTQLWRWCIVLTLLSLLAEILLIRLPRKQKEAQQPHNK